MSQRVLSAGRYTLYFIQMSQRVLSAGEVFRPSAYESKGTKELGLDIIAILTVSSYS